jgi:hypothetical protein
MLPPGSNHERCRAPTMRRFRLFIIQNPEEH